MSLYPAGLQVGQVTLNLKILIHCLMRFNNAAFSDTYDPQINRV